MADNAHGLIAPAGGSICSSFIPQEQIPGSRLSLLHVLVRPSFVFSSFRNKCTILSFTNQKSKIYNLRPPYLFLLCSSGSNPSVQSSITNQKSTISNLPIRSSVVPRNEYPARSRMFGLEFIPVVRSGGTHKGKTKIHPVLMRAC